MDRCYITAITTRWQQYLPGCVPWPSECFSVTAEEMVFLPASTFRNKLLFEKLRSATVFSTRSFISVSLFLN